MHQRVESVEGAARVLVRVWVAHALGNPFYGFGIGREIHVPKKNDPVERVLMARDD